MSKIKAHNGSPTAALVNDVLEKKLRKLVTDLIPEPAYREARTKEVEKVIKFVLRKSPWPVDRVRYAGSTKKHTDVMSADFDVVLFLNNKEIEISSVLIAWKEKLLQKAAKKHMTIVDNKIESSEICLQFLLECETGNIAVDLLPAYNLVQRNLYPRLRRNKLVSIQTDNVKKVLTQHNHSRYSSSLSESQIGFIKQQNEFTHQVIRLVKFWFKTLYLGKRSIYGLKPALEIIAVSVSKAEWSRFKTKKSKNSKLQTVFLEFLEQVKKIDKLRLAFRKQANGIWTQLTDDELPQTKPNDEYFIIEPSNAFNDLTEEFKERQKELENLKSAAKVTQKRVLELATESWFKIFRPVFKISHFFENNDLPSVFVCDFFETYNKYDCLCYKNFKKPFAVNQEVLTAIEIALSTFVRAAASEFMVLENLTLTNKPVMDEDKFIPLVETMIKEDIIMDGGVEEKDKSKIQHGECDVTYYVPFCKYLGSGCLRVSFKWE